MSSEQNAMQTVLITGVAGFIGSNFAHRLIQEGNYRVVGIDNLSYGVIEQVPSAVEFHELDVRSGDIFAVFKDVDYVFHLAAKNCISSSSSYAPKSQSHETVSIVHIAIKAPTR